METHSMIKWLVLLVSCATLHAAELRRTPPIPPEPVKASLSDVQTAIRTLVVLDVATTIQAHTNSAETLAYRFRAIADGFRDMSANGTLSVENLQSVMAMSKLSDDKDPASDSFESAKTALVTVYARCYAHRGRAGVSNLDYLASVSKTFSEAIREGIRKGGKSAVVE